MNTISLRSFSKITSNAFKNSCRLFSYKFEMTPRVAHESTSSTVEEVAAAPSEEQPTNNFRYNVIKPRTSPMEKPSTAGDILATKKQMVQNAIQDQHLQPSSMPEYYQRKMEKSAFVSTDPEPSEKDKAITHRRFQVSKTHENAIFPLKTVKLANPFPEPVKMMMSRTVSDEEKAEQMLADSRSQRNYSDWSKGPTGQRNLSSGTRRWYSSKTKTEGTEKGKCRKFGAAKGAKVCPKLAMPNCPPKGRTKCMQLPQVVHCKKQDAPYPAYSEFCHEELEEKTAECKLCSWSKEDHPTFRPTKKHYHTSAPPLGFKRTGLEREDSVEKLEEIVVANVPESGDFTLEEAAEEKGMLCDLRKPECEKPKSRRCPPDSDKGHKHKKDKHKKEKTPKKKASSQDLVEEILPAERVQSVLYCKKEDETKGNCKIRKFKFPACPQTYERLKEAPTGVCRKKIKKKKIIDCPATNPNEKCAESGIVNLEYSMKGEKDPKDTARCPKIDLTTDDSLEEEKEPCRQKKVTEKICPKDLLHKKRRKPKKKTSDMIIPPVNEPPKKEQPQITIKPPY